MGPRVSSEAALFSVELAETPVTWLAKNLKMAGDIEENPGPKSEQRPEKKSSIWNCSLCGKGIAHTELSIPCNDETRHWVHVKCTKTTLEKYTPKWKCPKHKDDAVPLDFSGFVDHNFEGFEDTEEVEINNHESLSKNGNEKQLEGNKNKDKSGKKIKIRILQLNANGLKSKIVELNELINKLKPDVICIQESKLKANHVM